MKEHRKIQWVVMIILPLLLSFVVFFFFWDQLSPPERSFLFKSLKRNSAYLLIAAILFIGFVGIALEAFLRLLILPLKRLSEETALIGMVNPQHRLQIEGGDIVQRIVKSINAIAIRFEAMVKYDQGKIQHIKSEVEKERNFLAAVLSELPEGVLICNNDGRILLYNQRVKQFFNENKKSSDPADASGTSHAPIIGLGRSVYSVVDENQIRHALEEVTAKLNQNKSNDASYFVTTSSAGDMLRVEVVPVLDHNSTFSGFVLIFKDITHQLHAADWVYETMQNMAKKIRASSAGIRAVIEAILEYPDMDKTQLDRFRAIIYKEAVSLAELLETDAMDAITDRKSEWPLMRLPLKELFKTIRIKAKEKTGISIQCHDIPDDLYIRADSYIFSHVVIYFLQKVHQEIGPAVFSVRSGVSGKFIVFDLLWSGQPAKIDMLRKWHEGSIELLGKKLPFTVKEVMGRHESEVCAYSTQGLDRESSLRFFIPVCEDLSDEQIRRMTVLPQSRPEYFDFDLFTGADRNPDQDKLSLSKLRYTVFDTETTGLDPDGGDEIISIGAVRIVNGRLLREECFEQLVDPKRHIPEASILIHGIQQEMITDQPLITSVLPRFHRFVSDTIMVAHNASFDMRMLYLKEKDTGIKFTNPVLDTLLLSTIVHPTLRDHTLEAIAGRLGVSIEGRHTAIGDCITTGKMFIRMVPLLAEKGILTLEDALNASKKSYYARIKY